MRDLVRSLHAGSNVSPDAPSRVLKKHPADTAFHDLALTHASQATGEFGRVNLHVMNHMAANWILMANYHLRV